MYVIKRDGSKEEVHFDKVTARIRKLTNGLDARYIDPVSSMALYVQSVWAICAKRNQFVTRHNTQHMLASPVFPLKSAGCGGDEGRAGYLQWRHHARAGSAGRGDL